MPNLQSTIDLIFNGVDNASQVVDRLAGNVSTKLDQVSKFGGQLEFMAAPLANVADRILQTEAAVTAMGAAMVGVAVNETGKFNDAFAFTTTLFEGTSAQIGQFRQDILDYAQGSTQSIEVINQALQSAIGQGIDYKDSLGLISEAEKLAVAQGASLKDSTELLAGSMNAYGLKVDQAAKLSDIFSITVRDGKISIEQLNAQFANMTPLAAAAGVGAEQLGAAVAALTSQGFKAEQAVTGTKNIIEGIIKPTDEAAKFASSLGLQFNATALQSKGLQGVLVDVQKATGGNVEKMAQLFTTSEGLTAALALSGKGAAAFAKELEAMRTETGVTAAAFEKMAANVALGAQQIKNALTVAFVNLATPLMDEIGKIGSGIAKVLSETGSQFKDGGALRPITAALEEMGASAGKIIDQIAANLPAAFNKVDVSRLIESYKALGDELAGAFKGFFGDIDLSTVDGLAAAVQKVIDSIEFLTRASAGIVNAFKPAAEAAGQVIDQFSRLDQASQFDFGKFIGSAKLIVDAGAGIGTALIAIGQTAADLTPIFDIVFGGIKVGANVLQVAFDGWALGVLTLHKSLMEAGLAVAEFGAKFALTDAAQKQNDAAINNFKQRLKELEPVMDGVAANLERNKKELSEGWGQATGEASSKTEAMNQRLEAARERMASLKGAIAENKASLMDWSDGISGTDGALKAVREGILKANDQMMDWSNGLVEGAKRVITFGDATQTLVPKLVVVQDANGNLIRSFVDMKAEMGKSLPPIPLPEGVTKAVGVFKEGGLEAGRYATAVSDISTVYGGAGTALIKATGPFKAVGDTAKTTAEKIDEAKKKSNEFLEKMEQIASNERIKTMEFAVNLKVESLKADAERVKATFASIDTTIKSTGDLLGSLFGNLTSATDIHDKLNIERQIDLENKRRQEALDIQKRLAEAEILRVEAQTRALDRGDALLKIDGTGLEPEIRAFMFKIIKLLRTEMSSQFSDFLLGMGQT
jgi:TP901 family phage tail tape measure protein